MRTQKGELSLRSKLCFQDVESVMRCIHPRPLNNSPDYINLYQRFLVYGIIMRQKICLPYVLFQYLKDCIHKSRTTADETKPPKIFYIPFGRLISDILT